jgi:hypothetical protein
MKLMLYAILILLAALIIPLDISWYGLRVSVFLAGYVVGLSLFIIGFGRSMSLPGFKRWNAPVYTRGRAGKDWRVGAG